MSSQPVQGRPPSDTEQLWLDTGQELVKGSLGALNEAAKNLLTLLGVLSGLYFGAVKFDNPHQQIANIGAAWSIPTGLIVALFALPLVIWLASAACAAFSLIVSTLTIDSPTQLSEQIREMGQVKSRWLIAGWWLLFAGLFFLIVNLVLYLGQ